MMESIMITTLAGYIGLVLGTGLMELINYGMMMQSAGQVSDEQSGTMFLNPTVDINIAIYSTLLLIVAGAIAGYIPAKRAASIKPIVALRDE